MAFDYKKEYKEFYAPPSKPTLVEVPAMNFLAVQGQGDPNEEDGEYSRAMALLYPLAYTLKMSYKGPYKIAGFFEYVVPPLEGFWWQEEEPFDFTDKSRFCWRSLLRLPDFIRPADFDWAVAEATRKKGLDFSPVRFYTHTEGLCVQCLHRGSYDHEAATILLMEEHAREHGFRFDLSDTRFHHEIYLGDPRKTAVEKRRTVIRYPIAPAAPSV